MKISLFILLIVIPSSIYAQTIFVPIGNNGSKNYKIETDSSTIDVTTHESLNSIRQFNELKNKRISYYKDYYNDTKTIREEGVFTNSNSSGIWKLYDKKGRVESIIDHDKGIWTVMNKNKFPFYDLRMKMKRKADSIVKSIYGKDFFEKSVVFCFDGSGMSNENEYGSWTHEFTEKPIKFIISYNVKFDDSHTYRDILKFNLDRNGNYIPDNYENSNGFEKLPANSKHAFKLTYNNAIEMARQRGFVETDTAKLIAFLQWESFKTPQLYNGNYKFCVLQRFNTTVSNNNGRTTRIDLYKVLEFNPWTGEFIKEKQMKRINARERDSGYDSGFLEVK